MSDAKVGTWVVQLDNDESDESEFASGQALVAFLTSLRATPSGQIVGFLDCGPARWWERFLGMSPRRRNPRFALEWSSGFAALIFLDDAGSEHRALDHEQPVDPPEEIKLQLAHGELVAPESEECMNVDRAWRAVSEFIHGGARPAWLKYRYVR